MERIRSIAEGIVGIFLVLALLVYCAWLTATGRGKEADAIFGIGSPDEY